jgi:hypothetical protein
MEGNMPTQNLKQEKNSKTHQDPQGILSQIKTDQDSPGILTESKPVLISSKEYNCIKLEDITSYTGILDYIEPKPSAFPTIVKTPSHHFCIDGEYLIQEAIKEKESSILCHVVNINSESELEIAIQKATIRTISDEGKPHFAEMVRNCKKLLEIFLSTMENPVLYSHGGNRKGINYNPANREDNIRVLLAERFGKSKSTIDKYINYGEYLDDVIMDSIIQSNVAKKYFEDAASNKRRLIKNLKSEEKDEEFISKKVSEYMAYWLEEWCESGNKKINPLTFENNTPPVKDRCPILLPSEFEHLGEVEHEEDEQSEQSLRQELQSLGLAIYTDLNDENFGTEESVEQLKCNVTQVLTLTNKLSIIKEVA